MDKKKELSSPDIQKVVWATAEKITRRYLDREELKELVQDINLKLWEKGLDQFDPTKGMKLTTWTYLVAQCAALDAIRSKKRQPPNSAFISPAAGYDPPCPQADAFARVLEKERLSLLDAALDKLPKDESEFVRECVLDEFNAEQYAQAHGCTVQNVYLRRHRAIKKLTAMLSKKGS